MAVACKKKWKEPGDLSFQRENSARGLRSTYCEENMYTWTEIHREVFRVALVSKQPDSTFNGGSKKEEIQYDFPRDHR
jgi:hypothetical protein